MESSRTFLACRSVGDSVAWPSTDEPSNKSEFVQQITSQGGDGPTAESLWERLKDCIYTDAFTPYPTDDLQAIFGITDEELDEDLVLAILREEKVSIPTEEILSDFGPTWTPLQVALLVKRCRRVDAGQI
jgi:hypothetical protein